MELSNAVQGFSRASQFSVDERPHDELILESAADIRCESEVNCNKPFRDRSPNPSIPMYTRTSF